MATYDVIRVTEKNQASDIGATDEERTLTEGDNSVFSPDEINAVRKDGEWEEKRKQGKRKVRQYEWKDHSKNDSKDDQTNDRVPVPLGNQSGEPETSSCRLRIVRRLGAHGSTTPLPLRVIRAVMR